MFANLLGRAFFSFLLALEEVCKTFREAYVGLAPTLALEPRGKWKSNRAPLCPPLTTILNSSGPIMRYALKVFGRCSTYWNGGITWSRGSPSNLESNRISWRG